MENQSVINNKMNISLNRNKKSSFLRYFEQFDLQSMVLPGLLVMLIFNYIPMYGIIIAFKKYNLITGFFNSPWIGLKNFSDFFMDDMFIKAVTNTLGINILGLIIAFPAPIIFAILLNELRSSVFKRVTQTISYLPNFVSWVIYGGLVIRLLAVNNGALNTLLMNLGLAKEAVPFMGDPKYFWWVSIFTNIFKNLGWWAIIYIAAIASIDMEVVEASIVDGAGRFRRIWHITLPYISGTIAIFLIFSISSILNSGFDQIWMLQNQANIDASEVIDTYVYKVGLAQLNFSYAAAVGLARSVIALILLLSANFVSNKVGDKGLF